MNKIDNLQSLNLKTLLLIGVVCVFFWILLPQIFISYFFTLIFSIQLLRVVISATKIEWDNELVRLKYLYGTKEYSINSISYKLEKKYSSTPGVLEYLLLYNGNKKIATIVIALQNKDLLNYFTKMLKSKT